MRKDIRIPPKKLGDTAGGRRMLQGRVPPSVLTRHYLVPDQYFKSDVKKTLKQLEQRLS